MWRSIRKGFYGWCQERSDTLCAGPEMALLPGGQNQERTCDQRLREQARSHALRAESVYRPDQAASRRFAAGAGGVATLSVPGPEMGLLPGGRASELARELSGTDSETVTYGTSGTTEVASFAAGPRQFANKFAPTPGGQNQERTCVSRAIRSSRRRSTPWIRLFPGVCRAFLDGLLDRTLAVVFRAAGEEPDQEGRQ